jgi:four helix bundle protein
VRDYNKLLVWQKAHALALSVNAASVQLPRERTALAAQMRRSAESIATNIVEGSARQSQSEFARFLQISVGSSSELEYQLKLAHDYGAMDLATWQRLSAQTIEVRRMLIGLIRKIKTDSAASSRAMRNELNPNG